MSWSVFAVVPLPPGASSEISGSQIALPSFLRLLAELTSIRSSLLQLIIRMRLSIHLRTATGWPYAAIYRYAGCPSAVIYPHAGFRSAANYPSAASYLSAYWISRLHARCLSDWRTAFICRWAEYCFCWRVLILELVAGDGKVFWGLRKRWMAVDVARFGRLTQR